MNLDDHMNDYLPNHVTDDWKPETMGKVIASWGYTVINAAPRGGCSMLVHTAEGFKVSYNGYVSKGVDK